MYTEESKIVSTTIAANGTISYSVVTSVYKDGELFSQSKPHTKSLEPDAPLDGEPESIVALANIVWTPEVIAQHKSAVEAGQFK